MSRRGKLRVFALGSPVIFKVLLLVFVSILLITLIPNASAIGPTIRGESNFVRSENASDPFRSEIAVPIVKNITVVPTNTTVDLPSQMNPTLFTIDVANGFEPTQRFNSEFNLTLSRESHVSFSSMQQVESGLSFFFNVSKPTNVSIAAYDLLFESPRTVSRTDYISFALSTDRGYNSTQAYIGFALLLRDQQDERHYVSVEVSDRYLSDIFSMSEWFLGWGYTKEYPEYPHYSLRYGAEYGPWFVQLSLSEPFDFLNLSSARLEGFLVGGEIFSRARTLEEVDAVFHFILIHDQPFLINQRLVSSPVVTFPCQEGLSFSGIPWVSASLNVSGLLTPKDDDEERLENNTISRREVFFDLSQASQAGFAVKGNVKITVFSKTVKKCLLTFDNNTIDFTDELLSAVLYNSTNPLFFEELQSSSTLKVLLILYRFNAWIFSFSGFQIVDVTKMDIVEERFTLDENEALIRINTNESTNGRDLNLAIRTESLTPTILKLNGVEKPVESMLIIEEETHSVVPLVGYPENVSLYVLQLVFSDRPIYEVPTTSPFNIYFRGSVFRILTPFNVEGEHGFSIPLTIQMITSRTFHLEIECDSSFFEFQRNKIMAYSTLIHYEYFMLRPLKTGQSVVTFKITNPTTRKTYFSSLFLVTVSTSLLHQLVPYFLLGVTGLSIVAAVSGTSFRKIMSRRRVNHEAKQGVGLTEVIRR